MSGELCIDPASLAQKAAERVFAQPDILERLPEDTQLIDDLYETAVQFDLVGHPYWVETSRGVSLPKRFESDEKVRKIDFFRLAFEGRFLRYSKVVMGKGIGNTSIQALCLTFDRALLLPDLDPLPSGHVLHVPAPAVNSIRSQYLA